MASWEKAIEEYLNSYMESNCVLHYWTTFKMSIWNHPRAARKLGINQITIWRNIKKYIIEIPTE